MINIAGIVSVVVFYLLILGVGIWAARKKQGGAVQEVRPGVLMKSLLGQS